MSHALKQAYVANSAEVNNDSLAFKLHVPASFVSVATDDFGIHHRDATNAEIAERITKSLNLPANLVSVVEDGVKKSPKNNHFDVSVNVSKPDPSQLVASKSFFAFRDALLEISRAENADPEKAHSEALEINRNGSWQR